MQNNITAKIIKSTDNNPWYNLALEEMLFNGVKDDEIILYIWQNDNTVVIGRNQNPWRECRWNELEKDGGKLARRLSGGGAVYHDLGNLNFTFIMKKNKFDITKQLQLIISAVSKLGIKAEFSGRNDIIAEGKKFSGNAFYYDEDRCYHHGTLLVCSDITKLSKYLSVTKEKMESKGIKSVKSRVVNLQGINPSVTIENLSKALEESFNENYTLEIKETIIKDGNMDEIREIYDKYSSWEWRYGETPKFNIMYYNRFNFGDIDIQFNLKDGRVDRIEIYSDMMNSNLILDIKQSLRGVKFSKYDISNALNQLTNNYRNIVDKNIISDITKWILEKDI